jgi:hypothetical protein
VSDYQVFDMAKFLRLKINQMIANIIGYNEVADFLANLDPHKLIEWKPSDTVQKRVEDLIYKKKDGQISSDELYELERYMALEHLIALTKARARKNITL